MIIENELVLPIPPDQAWQILLDIPFVAPCLPGTSLTKIIDDVTYEGTVQLKLGPVGLSFRGTAILEDVAPETRTVRVAARGREDRGKGSAHATVNFKFIEIASGTRVVVKTDLNLAGSIVQYARGAGIIERTAQQLAYQFSERLQSRIENGELPENSSIQLGALVWKGVTKNSNA